MRAAVVACFIALFAVTSCAPKGPIEPAGKPRRPEAAAAKPAPPKGQTDCPPLGDDTAKPNSLRYDERRVVEAENLARDGVTKLAAAANQTVEKFEREALVTDAVSLLIVALKADPYNVHATYNLAAAYARIGREQCSLNLLERLILLRNLASQKVAVEQKLDRLFGRGEWAGKLDPDFNDMRGKASFRELAKQMD